MKPKYLSRLTLILSILVCTSFCKKKEVNITPLPTSNSPNIIVIIADDMGWDAFGKYEGINGMKAKTPTLDSLAKTGITFTNYWVYPECAPTRAALLTGRYGFRTGIGGVMANATPTLKSDEIIIQKYINSKTADAYATAVIGKWHVSGNTTLNAPESFGVQYFSGFLAGAVPDNYAWTQTSNGTQQNITTYTTTHFVDQSVSWVKKQSKPFFLWLAFNAPHSPYQAPPKNLISDAALSAYQDASGDPTSAYYLSSIEAMDKEIRRLISALTEEQRKNTVFVFMGDNGTPARVVQAPFITATAKSSLFQGGINTPLLISGKNVNRKNVTETAMVQATDIFATLADIAAISAIDAKDGKSIMPLFNDANASKRTFAYSELFGSSQTNNNGYTVRNEAYKFIHLDNGKEYLYKISIDKFESDNLFDRPLTTEAQNNLTDLKLIKSKL